MAVRLQIRNDTSINWTSVNPILAVGELAIETDTRKFKIGDGVTEWNSLLYATQGETGPQGDNIEYTWDGTSLGIRVEGETTYTYVDLQGEQGIQGIQGEPGTSIQSVTRTSGDGSPGTTDTYTITYTDATTSTFTVYNGADGVASNAASLPYDNTTSGLTATNTQDAIDEVESLAHTHTNKTVLDDLSDNGGTLLYNGQEISGSPDNLTSTELTLGNYKISYNSTEDSLDFEVIV